MYLNRVMLLGNLTRDPELRTLPSGTYVATIGLATNRTYKDKNGAKQEDTQFHNVVVFGRQAEVMAQYAKKGSSLYVEGRLQTRSWDDKDGTKKYRTEVVVENFQFGPRGAGQGSAPTGQNSVAPKATSVPPTAAPSVELDTIEYPSEDINPEDIPF